MSSYTGLMVFIFFSCCFETLCPYVSFEFILHKVSLSKCRRRQQTLWFLSCLCDYARISLQAFISFRNFEVPTQKRFFVLFWESSVWVIHLLNFCVGSPPIGHLCCFLGLGLITCKMVGKQPRGITGTPGVVAIFCVTTLVMLNCGLGWNFPCCRQGSRSTMLSLSLRPLRWAHLHIFSVLFVAKCLCCWSWVFPRVTFTCQAIDDCMPGFATQMNQMTIYLHVSLCKGCILKLLPEPPRCSSGGSRKELMQKAPLALYTEAADPAMPIELLYYPTGLVAWQEVMTLRLWNVVSWSSPALR